VGNRLSANSTLSGVSSGSYSYNINDLLSIETYDSNGNTLITGGKTFTYDSENRLKSMNGSAVLLQYDGDGNRVAKTVGGVTTRYLVDDLNPTGYSQVVEEVVNGAVQQKYSYGLQRISENQVVNNVWTPSFYGYDGGGSVRQLTNSAGAITDKYDYDAFGNLVNSTGTTPNDYRYRGEQYDPDLGLYYLRARYYNPATGRFLSRDPRESCNCSIKHPGSLHKYLYASGDPINRLDPSGRADVQEAVVIDARDLLASAALTYVGSRLACSFRTDAAVVAAVSDPRNLGGPQTLDIFGSICSAISSKMPNIPRPGEVPATIDPLEVITAPGSGWGPGCNAALTDCEKRCPNGNTETLHFDPGIIYNEGPHWDYKDCDGNTWKIWPNGTMTPARS
jgi:RHS repeat-associated protein